MTISSALGQQAMAIWWKDLDRWNVRSGRSRSWQWSRSVIKPLASALKRRSEPVDKKSFKLLPENFVSLRFSGQIEARDLHGKRDFKGALFFAYAGDIIYSKIDVRNGAIGIIPPSIPLAVVTSEFPVYSIRENVACSQYVQLVFRTEHFRSIINSMISGASGRKRVQPDELEAVEIPIPSLAVQEAIVARWCKAQKEIAAARERVEKLRANIDARFFAGLGLRSPDAVAMPKAFAVWWADFLRWGVGFNFLKQSAPDLSRGKYPVVELGSLLDLVQYGTSEKANTISDGVAVVRMNNIVDGQLDVTDLKHIRLPRREAERLALKEGDILFNRTNSKELVGKCAVFHAKGEFVFASYLIRVRANPAKVDADFLACVVNSPIGRQQINALSRRIIGQANVNSEELRALETPLPPLAVQKQIMECVAAGRSEIAREREDADRIAHNINIEIEALILGAKKVSEL